MTSQKLIKNRFAMSLDEAYEYDLIEIQEELWLIRKDATVDEDEKDAVNARSEADA